jgi:methylated-DNA-[protein]-cysteine S-methyltransferase
MALSRVVVTSPVGRWVVEGDADGITQIELPHSGARSSTGPVPRAVSSTAKQLEEYFAGKRRSFEVDLHLTGSAFDQSVWTALTEIPYGEVRTYGEIADAIGKPTAYRAVGNANGRNPWPIIVPCHRVVASSGLGGYAGGLDVKRYLLGLEGAL